MGMIVAFGWTIGKIISIGWAGRILSRAWTAHGHRRKEGGRKSRTPETHRETGLLNMGHQESNFSLTACIKKLFLGEENPATPKNILFKISTYSLLYSLIALGVDFQSCE